MNYWFWERFHDEPLSQRRSLVFVSVLVGQLNMSTKFVRMQSPLKIRLNMIMYKIKSFSLYRKTRSYFLHNIIFLEMQKNVNLTLFDFPWSLSCKKYLHDCWLVQEILACASCKKPPLLTKNILFANVEISSPNGFSLNTTSPIRPVDSMKTFECLGKIFNCF